MAPDFVWVFVEVLREFASKKHVRLSKLLLAQKERSRRVKLQREGSGGEGAQQSSHAEVMGGFVILLYVRVFLLI